MQTATTSNIVGLKALVDIHPKNNGVRTLRAILKDDTAINARVKDNSIAAAIETIAARLESDEQRKQLRDRADKRFPGWTQLNDDVELVSDTNIEVDVIESEPVAFDYTCKNGHSYNKQETKPVNKCPQCGTMGKKQQ